MKDTAKQSPIGLIQSPISKARAAYGERQFRDRYAGSKSQILEYTPGRHRQSKTMVSFICHGCERKVTQEVRTRRQDDGDLLCGQCLHLHAVGTRVERGWKPRDQRKVTVDFVQDYFR